MIKRGSVFRRPPRVDSHSPELVVLRTKPCSGAIEKTAKLIPLCFVRQNRLGIVDLIVAVDLNIQLSPILVAHVLDD